MIRKAAFFCRALIKKLVLSLKRFPEAVLLCAMTVSILIFMNHSYAQKGTEDMLMRICLILALGVPVVLCVKMLFETIPNLKKNLKVLIYVCSVAGLTFYLVFFAERCKNRIYDSIYSLFDSFLFSFFVYTLSLQKRKFRTVCNHSSFEVFSNLYIFHGIICRFCRNTFYDQPTFFD